MPSQTASNSNESYCTFTLPSDVTTGGLPSQEEIAKDLESSDPNVRCLFACFRRFSFRYCSFSSVPRITRRPRSFYG